MTWKTTKTAHIPIKTVPNISPVTQWCEENIPYVILLLHASAEAPTATCAIINLSLLKQAVFIIVPIILLNTVLHLKGQFAFVDVLLQPKSS